MLAIQFRKINLTEGSCIHSVSLVHGPYRWNLKAGFAFLVGTHVQAILIESDKVLWWRECRDRESL